MRVLYLSYDGLTDPLGQSQILPYLEGLSIRFSITLVTFEKRKRFQAEGQCVMRRVNKANIHWVPLHYHKIPPVLSTIYDLYVLWRTVGAHLKHNRIDLVHCRSYITALVGLRLKRKRGIPFIFDMRGFWADERVEGGLWNLGNPFYRIIYNQFKNWEKQFVKFADVVITLTHSGRTEVLSWGLNNNVEVIPCCVDATLFDPSNVVPNPRDTIGKELGIGADDFVLVYSGSVGTWYLLAEMIAFYGALRSQVELPTKFLILTTDPIDSSLLQWPDEIIAKSVGRDEMPTYLSLANASVFFIKPTYSKKGSSATKMAELMAMNIPYITNAGWGDVDNLVDRRRGGILISRMDESSFRQGAIQLTSGSFSAARPSALDYFSLSEGIHKYGEWYAHIGQQKE